MDFFPARKILDDVLPVPMGDETCRFASCFTSLLMKIEKYHGTETFLCERTQTPCTRCGECQYATEPNTFKGVHNELYNFIQLALGGRQQVVRMNAMLGYSGYDFRVFSSDNWKDAVKGNIVQSINNEVPVLLSLKNAPGRWCLITGYGENGETLFGFDGLLDYWKDTQDGLTRAKDGYLANKMFYWNRWSDGWDQVVFITRKTAPSVGLETLLLLLINNVVQDNEIIARSKSKLLDDLSTLNHEALLQHFNDCFAIFYEQADTRHKIYCALRGFIYQRTGEVNKPLVNQAAGLFLKVHEYVVQAFGILGETWQVFFHPEPYLSEYEKPDQRLALARIFDQVIQANLAAVKVIQLIIKP